MDYFDSHHSSPIVIITIYKMDLSAAMPIRQYFTIANVVILNCSSVSISIAFSDRFICDVITGRWTDTAARSQADPHSDRKAKQSGVDFLLVDWAMLRPKKFHIHTSIWVLCTE